jgi:hypothetical protein
VLPSDPTVVLEVAHDLEAPGSRVLEEDPSDVGPEPALLDVVRISIPVDEAMVIAVIERPAESGVLESRGPEKEVEGLHRPAALVRAMRIVAVVAGGDRERGRHRQYHERDNGRGIESSVGKTVVKEARDGDERKRDQHRGVEPAEGRFEAGSGHSSGANGR